ncbi:TPA: EAL domain-containing protein [Clostridium perfringens]|uniref:GGDEF domain-containing phosphodiesterase n=1 Tax=Clostridium perfringens TaxID=1502 RepID=UPI001CB01936|nr:GGDEF domain-containing phosphodiesterase [Clostridium perfringens]MDH5095446.1 Oxygen sensor protein DosP [Clostridium perfringens]HBI6990067.1 EAL domain-containing protein [Clostridium perfringens]HBI6992993.1 EAL domain-containing protein [Clostridium perfringens]HBI6998913.1 EAL domain-containing protein [Clostridium perfringens]HBI7025573.1 EAL domain-containing protein [Clostridium perfringens]
MTHRPMLNKIKLFFIVQIILSFLVLAGTLLSILVIPSHLPDYFIWAIAFSFWIFQCGISTLFAFKYRVSKNSLNTIKLSFILIESIQILTSLTTNLFGIFNLSIFKIILLKNIQFIILSLLVILMIYKLIKGMLKYSVLKDYIIRDSFFTFIPFAFIIYKNSRYFISSIYFLDDSVYSLFLLNINSLRIFLEGFLIILIFVKTIYLQTDKKSSFLLLINFYILNLNCYIISYFNNKVFLSHCLYEGIGIYFICPFLLMFSIYYSIKEQDKDLNQVLFDDSYMNINNSWISITIGIFPVSFAAIDITASSISTRNLAGVENVIIILLIMFLLVSRDVLLRKDNLRLIASVKRANEIDFLTNMYGRNYFLKKLETITNDYALFFIDIKSFKDINNIFGHVVGDKVLVEVANKFKELKLLLGKNVFYCRYSGNEFALISKLEQVDLILKFFRDLENIKIQHNSDLIHINFNIGYSLNDSNINLDLLIQETDYALMRAKKLKGPNNSILMYDDNLKTDLEHMNILKKDFKNDLLTGKFHLVFQPKVCVKTLKIVGFETLLRWKHDKLGEISPCKFVPIAENLGEISSLDLYVFKKSCEFQRYLIDKGIKLKCSVNLSLNTLKSYEKINEILNIYKEYKIPKHLITAEILENVSLNNNAKTISYINLLRENGICISIDDFGTGYSSLSQISNLYFDELKIPREFVIDARTPSKLAVIEAISILAKKLKVISVIEGVETYEDFKLFSSLGFDIVQGYYFSKPLTKSEIIDYIKVNINNKIS